MKVSIVTLSFNQAAFLERAMRSVLGQDHPDIEYILVDPGSTDGSRDIIARHRDRVADAVLEPDRGAADGLNKGFAHATGDILGYLNADDVLLPGAVSAAVAAFERNPRADVVSGHGYIVGPDGRVARRFRSDRFDAWRYAFGGAVVMQQSTFFRRRAFAAAGGFNPDNVTSWDGELMLDMALAGMRFVVVDGYWSVFRHHPASISGSRRLDAESRRNWDRYFERVTGRPPRAADWPLRAWAKLRKRLDDPVGLWWRLRDATLGAATPPEVSAALGVDEKGAS